MSGASAYFPVNHTTSHLIIHHTASLLSSNAPSSSQWVTINIAKGEPVPDSSECLQVCHIHTVPPYPALHYPTPLPHALFFHHARHATQLYSPHLPPLRSPLSHLAKLGSKGVPIRVSIALFYTSTALAYPFGSAHCKSQSNIISLCFSCSIFLSCSSYTALFYAALDVYAR